MIVTVWIAVPLLTAAAAGCLVRVARGPSMLDRAIGLDVLVSILVVALALEAALHRQTSTLVILVVLSLVAFVGSVSLARFAVREDNGGGPR